MKVLLLSVTLLLCIVGTVCGNSVGTVQRHSLSDVAPSVDSSVSPFTRASFDHPPPVISTSPPIVTPPHPGHPGSGSGSPIGNWFRCAKQFELLVFSVKEIYVTNSTSEIFSLENNQLIGLAAGNCPDIEGTLSPTGSGAALQSCVFTYELFNRGRFVETGTFDPSPNGVSNNAVTGIDGEFFQALGLEHIQNFADGTGGIDTFYFCLVNTNTCPQEHDNKDPDHGKDGHNHP